MSITCVSSILPDLLMGGNEEHMLNKKPLSSYIALKVYCQFKR